MKKKSTSQSAFFNLRVLVGLFIALAGVSLALLATPKPAVCAASAKRVVAPSAAVTTVNADEPNQVAVAYADTRRRHFTPINISGASVSTDGRNTFTRLTKVNGPSPFANTFGDPVVLSPKPSGTWVTVW